MPLSSKPAEEMEVTEDIVNETKFEVEHVCGCQKKLERVREELATAWRRIRALKAWKPAEKEGQLCEVLACRACLATDTRLFGMQDHDLDAVFIQLTGQSFSVLDGLPRYLCAFCCTQLSKFAEFREKCQRARDLLETLRPIKIDDIRAIDRKSNDLALRFTQTAVHELNSIEPEPFLPVTLKIEAENEIDDTFDDKDSLDEPGFFVSTAKDEPTNIKQDDGNKMEIYPNVTTDVKNELVVVAIAPKPIKTKPATIKPRKRKICVLDSMTKDEPTNGKQENDNKMEMYSHDTTDNTFDDDTLGEPSFFDSKTEDEQTNGKKENDNKMEMYSHDTTDDTFDDNDSLGEPSFFDSKTEDEQTNGKKENDNKMEMYSHDTTYDKNELVVVAIAPKPIKTKPATTKPRKRKMLFDDVYPDFDYAEFEKSCKVKIDLLTLEQQKEDIENKKKRDNYLKSSHRCEMCGKGFNSAVTLRNHMGYHDPAIGPYECDICHFRFRDKKRRLKHRHLHRLRFTCAQPQCGFVSRDKHQARRHYETHQGKRYKCAHCPLTFACKSSSLSHARLMHPARGVACPTCGETFLSRLGVQLHIARAHRPNIQPTLKCDVCEATFSSSEALEKHSLSVTEETHFTHKPCLICGDLFENDEALATHTKDEHPPDQFRCEECEETFANAASFACHTRRKHLGERAAGGPRRPRGPNVPRGPGEPRGARAAGAVCEVCGKIMPNQSVLGYHLYIHMAKKPYACPHCEKTFAAKHSRDWHVRTHTGEKPFQCDMCPLSFTVPSNLSRHRKVVHLGQRRTSPCPLCGKIFSAPSAVKLHIDTVHQHKPAPRRRPRTKQPKPDKNIHT